MSQTTEITQAELTKLLYFDHGCFYWRKSRGRRHAGQRAGSTRYDGQRHITINGVQYLESRLSFCYANGTLPKKVRHQDGNLHNISPDNLTITPDLFPRGSKPSQYSTQRTETKGVLWIPEKQKYRVAYLNHYIGIFEDYEEAVRFRETAEELEVDGFCVTRSMVYELLGKEVSNGRSPGVSYNSRLCLYEAQLTQKGRRYFLGRFPTEGQARDRRSWATASSTSIEELNQVLVTPRKSRYCESPDRLTSCPVLRCDKIPDPSGLPTHMTEVYCGRHSEPFKNPHFDPINRRRCLASCKNPFYRDDECLASRDVIESPEDTAAFTYDGPPKDQSLFN